MNVINKYNIILYSQIYSGNLLFQLIIFRRTISQFFLIYLIALFI